MSHIFNQDNRYQNGRFQNGRSRNGRFHNDQFPKRPPKWTLFIQSYRRQKKFCEFSIEKTDIFDLNLVTANCKFSQQNVK